MAADAEETVAPAEDELEPYDATGQFEIDYVAHCERLNTKPARIIEKPVVTEPQKGENGDIIYSDKKWTPTIEVEYEEEKIVKDVTAKHWRLESTSMEAFTLACNGSLSLTSLSLVNCGLTSEGFTLLTGCIQQGNIRSLQLDWNPVPETLYAQLLGDASNLRTLSLRGNSIGNEGAGAIAEALKANRNLAMLNLWYNRIGDAGAVELAEALKSNRCLVVLSLGKNKIGDAGCTALAEVLSRYPLSHDAIVARRKLHLEEKQKRGEAEEAPPQATSAAGELKKPGSKGREESFSRQNLNEISGKKVAKAPEPAKTAKKGSEKSAPQPTAKDKAPPKKEDPKAKKGAPAKGAPPAEKSAAAEKGKGGKEKKGQSGKKRVEDVKEDQVEVENVNPLLEPVEEIDGLFFVTGNRVLVSLNLSYNDIGEPGFAALKHAVEIQQQTQGDGPHSGLARLFVQGNKLGAGHENYKTLTTMMAVRDPYYEPSQAPEVVPEEGEPAEVPEQQQP
eukprot:Colp12_sorted_trinity150504_noHs@15561